MDTAIEARGLALFVRTLQEQISEDRLHDIWLHKVRDGSSYGAFKRKVLFTAKNSTMTEREQEGIVAQSLDILSDFDPEGVS